MDAGCEEIDEAAAFALDNEGSGPTRVGPSRPLPLLLCLLVWLLSSPRKDLADSPLLCDSALALAKSLVLPEGLDT